MSKVSYEDVKKEINTTYEMWLDGLVSIDERDDRLLFTLGQFALNIVNSLQESNQ